MASRLGTALLDLDVATGPLTQLVSDLIGVRDLDDPVLAGLPRLERLVEVAALRARPWTEVTRPAYPGSGL